MADATVLNTVEGRPSCGFEPHLRDHVLPSTGSGLQPCRDVAAGDDPSARATEVGMVGVYDLPGLGTGEDTAVAFIATTDTTQASSGVIRHTVTAMGFGVEGTHDR